MGADMAAAVAIEQASAHLRDTFIELGVDVGDPETFRVVRLTVLLMVSIPVSRHDAFLRCLNELGN